ncbi:MAG: hypothetical protein AB4352_15490 [Hormoscilla sp.]
MMNDTLSLERVIEYIESLSPEDRAFLFDELHKRGLETPCQSQHTRSDNPWVRLAGTFEDDPQYDEVLAYIEEYRRELDSEMEAYDRQLDAEEEVK